MAKVIIIHYGGIKVDDKYKTFIFYEGLIEALRNNGNDVLEIITNDFLRQPWGGTNKLKIEIDKKKLIDDIINFEPELIISFNNSLIDGLEKIVTCPIAVWSADHFHHFNDLEKLKSNKDRFLFFCAQSGDTDDCKRIIGVNPSKCFRMKPATSLESNLKQEKTNNIVFVGSPFGNHSEKEALHNNKKEFVELAKKIINKEFSDDKLELVYKEKIPNVHEIILDFGSAANRSNVLSHIAPLGLVVHGGDGWLDIGLDSSLDIFNAYDSKLVYSILQTQNLYNNAKIGININHSQAKTGFSWRVMDILASSAVLVSNYSPDLVEELGEDLAKEIIYYSPQEAYEKCQKLLSNEELRCKIVKQCNEIVKKYHTWDIRIKEMEDILNLRLVNKNFNKGEYILLDAELYQKKVIMLIGKKLDWRRAVLFFLPHGIVKHLPMIKKMLRKKFNSLK